MAKKAELQEQARELGIDPEGLKVADLEDAITSAELAPVLAEPTGRPGVVASVDEGMVRLAFGYRSEGEFSETAVCLVDADEARALADVLPDLASASLNNRNLG